MAHLDETFSTRRPFEVSSAEDDSFFGPLYGWQGVGCNERSGQKTFEKAVVHVRSMQMIIVSPRVHLVISVIYIYIFICTH